MRFIEYMDVGDTNGWRLDDVVPAAEILARIGTLNGRSNSVVRRRTRAEVANRYRYLDGKGEVGVISSISQPFCGTLHPRPPERDRRGLHLPVRLDRARPSLPAGGSEAARTMKARVRLRFSQSSGRREPTVTRNCAWAPMRRTSGPSQGRDVVQGGLTGQSLTTSTDGKDLEWPV